MYEIINIIASKSVTLIKTKSKLN